MDAESSIVGYDVSLDQMVSSISMDSVFIVYNQIIRNGVVSGSDKRNNSNTRYIFHNVSMNHIVAGIQTNT